MISLSTAARSAAHVEFLSIIFKEVDLFKKMSDEQLNVLLNFVDYVEFEEGETILRQGEEGDAFYVIYSGVVLVKARGVFGFSRIRARLGAGDFFGELAVLFDRPRSATVVCEGKTRCFVLRKESLQALMKRDAGIAAIIQRFAEERKKGV